MCGWTVPYLASNVGGGAGDCGAGDCGAVVVVVYLILTDPLRIQPWSQDTRNQTKSNRISVIDFLFGPSIQVHALPVCLATEWVQQSHSASAASLSPPAYRICCLLTLVHLQSARFPRRCPETGKNSTASGLGLEPITANAVCSLGHRRRPNPLSYCCIGGNLCR